MTVLPEPAALFRSLSDETRLRLLRLLGREELNVQELVRITGLSQPRISKHLAILREHGWLTQRRTGTWSWHRAVDADAFPCGRELFQQALHLAEGVAGAAEDDRALALVLADRQARERDFFAGIADQWDSLRSQYDHPDIRVGALGALIERRLQVVDIGTGAGALLPLLGGVADSLVAVDHSLAMLQRARARCRNQGLTAARFCAADICDLPFADARFDVCSCSMALHHVAEPSRAVVEMARVVRPGGKVLVIAFRRHAMTWMRDELAHRWLGFARDEIEEMFRGAALVCESYLARPRLGRIEGQTAGAETAATRWPEVFLAVGAKTAA